MMIRSPMFLFLAALAVAACSPEQCEDQPEVCPDNSCGPCPCPKGSVCVEDDQCAALCSLDVQHIPGGNPCGWVSEEATCVVHPNTPSADVGVCRSPTGEPMCHKVGAT